MIEIGDEESVVECLHSFQSEALTAIALTGLLWSEHLGCIYSEMYLAALDTRKPKFSCFLLRNVESEALGELVPAVVKTEGVIVEEVTRVVFRLELVARGEGDHWDDSEEGA